MCRVVRDGRRSLEVGGGQRGWERVQFEHQQAESSDVRFPAAQVSHEVFFQFVGWNFIAHRSSR